MIKAVYIKNVGVSSYLQVGDILELTYGESGYKHINGGWILPETFLVLPKQETSCKDMTMQEYLAVMVLLNDDRYLVECWHGDESDCPSWAEPYNLLKTYRMPVRWSLKEDPKLKEIKRIKGEMEKLTKELKDLEGGS